MNKTEFVQAIAGEACLTKKQAEAFYQAQLKVIEETLKKGEKITLTGFGSYELKHKEAREIYNPLTKQKTKLEAANVPSFKMGNAFKDLF